MASPVSTDKLLSNLAVQHYDHDPDATSATDVAWVDMRDYGKFACSFFRTIGTSDITFKILANNASDGTGTDVEIKVWSGDQPDAVGDQIWLECTEEEIRQEADEAGVAARYVSANVTLATATDEGVVTYIRGEPRFAQDGLTADIVA